MNSFLEEYKESKKVRDLIKQPIFKTKSISGTYYHYNNHDLTFKITHVKEHGNWDGLLLVNVKVCGRMKGRGWCTDVNGMININTNSGFRSSISRNRLIRQHTEKEVTKYFRLFGVKAYHIEIGKVTIADTL